MPASHKAQVDYPELARAQADWRWRPPADALRGRVVLVTGAGAGIGCAAARTFACYGADVLLLGRNREPLEAVHDLIRAQTDTDPTIVPCDLERSGAADFTELATAVIDHYGRLDAVLHNASRLGARVPLEHYDATEWRRVMRVNLDAAVELTRSLLPALRRSADARVLFTSSSVGRAPRAYWGAYAVSKAAIEAACEIFAEEHEHEGIRFYSLNPGATRTAMRALAYPGEDPRTVAPPEARLDAYLALVGAAAPPRNLRIDARDWRP
jgi:NAD(P)-dependent dehydrogenase (short-subunit alcohol dehydrogenase family)